MRTKGAAIGTATNWICNFIVVEITPIGIQSQGWKFYIIWCVFNFSFVPLVYFLYPETAGRTLEDLDAYYRESPKLLVFRDKDVISSHRPEKFKLAEEDNLRKASSADAVTFRRQSRVSIGSRGMSGMMPETEKVKTDASSEYTHVDHGKTSTDFGAKDV